MALAELQATAASGYNPNAFDFNESEEWGAITMALRVQSGASTKVLAPDAKFSKIKTTGTTTISIVPVIDGIEFQSDVVWTGMEEASPAPPTTITDVRIVGDLDFLDGRTEMTFDNVTVTGDVTNSMGSVNLTINATNGTSISTSEPGTGNGQVNIVQTTQLTLTGLKNPTEVRVFDAGTTTEIDGTENVTTGSATYNIDSGTYTSVDISVLAIDYENIRLLAIDMASGAVSIPIQQRLDRQYKNP